MNLFYKLLPISTKVSLQEDLVLKLEKEPPPHDISVGVIFTLKNKKIDIECLRAGLQGALDIAAKHFPELNSQFTDNTRFYQNTSLTKTTVQERKRNETDLSNIFPRKPVFAGLYKDNNGNTIVELAIPHLYIDGSNGFPVAKKILTIMFGYYAYTKGLHLPFGNILGKMAKYFGQIKSLEEYKKEFPQKEITKESPIIGISVTQNKVWDSKEFKTYATALGEKTIQYKDISELTERAKRVEKTQSTLPKTNGKYFLPKKWIEEIARRYNIAPTVALRLIIGIVASKLNNHQDLVTRTPREKYDREGKSVGYLAVSSGEITDTGSGERTFQECITASKKWIKEFNTELEIDGQKYKPNDTIPIERILSLTDTGILTLGINILPKRSADIKTTVSAVVGETEYMYTVGDWPRNPLYNPAIAFEIGETDSKYMVEIYPRTDLENLEIPLINGIIDVIATLLLEKSETQKIKDFPLKGNGKEKLEEKEKENTKKCISRGTIALGVLATLATHILRNRKV